jgi:hypothetical protein
MCWRALFRHEEKWQVFVVKQGQAHRRACKSNFEPRDFDAPPTWFVPTANATTHFSFRTFKSASGLR